MKRGMTYADAMAKAREGVKVRHDGMNSRWSVVRVGERLMMTSTLGGSYPYDASERDKAATWRIA